MTKRRERFINHYDLKKALLPTIEGGGGTVVIRVYGNREFMLLQKAMLAIDPKIKWSGDLGRTVQPLHERIKKDGLNGKGRGRDLVIHLAMRPGGSLAWADGHISTIHETTVIDPLYVWRRRRND